MNPKIKFALVVVLLSVAIAPAMTIFEYKWFYGLKDLSADWFGLLPVYGLTTLDSVLIQYFPFLVGLTLALRRQYHISSLLEYTIKALLMIILALLLGFALALTTWSSENEISELLPGTMLFQPFDGYWTLFIIFGLGASLAHGYRKVFPR